ncbi:MAG: PilC/PilY family type IV pilus protein, partial [Gammaproteobacteria bacterium]
RGGGYFHSAQNAAQLRNAFGNIISKIQQLSATITQPSINVNQFNRLYHRNNVYYSLFSTSGKPNWEGNIKGYALKAQPDGAVRVVDVNGQAALDPNTNFFKSNAKSYWSKSADGKDVTKGGVLENLPNPSNRTLFTYLHHTLADPTKHKKALRAPQNALDVSNTTLRFDTMFGAADLQQMQQIIQWVKGVDILDEDHDGDKQEPRSALADSLHSSPIPVTYGGTPTQPDEVIFVGSNDGSLRAFDAQSGSEMWGFIPEELLPLQRQLFENNNVFHHSYGIDNTPVVWIDDNNHDGIIQPNTDRIMLYLTMRRGGRNVYALDITDKNNPRMKWVIRGGLGDYLNLGQTWSQPVLTSIQLANHAPQKVLILAGGYDPQHDIDINNMPDSSTGNALYIIDALTGKRITYASKSIDSSAVGLAMADMKHAFPATVNILDHNLDGLGDQIYVPDIAGDLWRFDITHQVNSASDLLHGGIIAHLGGDASTGGPRRFFAKPDLSLLPSGGRVTLTIGLGSGEATSPLNQTIQNRYYAITQPSSFLKPSKYQAIDEQDLTDISNGLQAEEALARGGWYLSLNQGEKVISSQSGTTFNQVGFFTTYSPITSASANANTANTTASSCTNIPTSTARLYAIDMRTGQSALDLNHDGQLNHSDRAVQLKTSAIPAAPSLLLLENVDHPVILVGTETPLEDMMASNPNLSSKNQEWKRIYWENHH